MCLSEPRRVNLLLCLLSSVIALYSAEILLAYSPSVLNHSSATAWLEFPQDANVRVAAERVERDKPTKILMFAHACKLCMDCEHKE